MNKFIIATLLLMITTSQSYAMSDREICEIRANIMTSIAKERDAGTPKKKVKKIIKQKLGEQLPDSFELYVDAVYENPKMSPTDMRTISLYSCYQEFGIIK